VPAHFASVIVELGAHVYAWVGLDLDPLIYAFCAAEMTGTHHHIQLSPIEMGSF
jgi:hypothetical protein